MHLLVSLSLLLAWSRSRKDLSVPKPSAKSGAFSTYSYSHFTNKEMACPWMQHKTLRGTSIILAFRAQIPHQAPWYTQPLTARDTMQMRWTIDATETPSEARKTNNTRSVLGQSTGDRNTHSCQQKLAIASWQQQLVFLQGFFYTSFS